MLAKNMKYITIFAVIIISGCASRHEVNGQWRSEGPPFLDHPNDAERYVARTGGVIGGIVGVPVAIVSLPITYPLQLITDDGKSDMHGLAYVGAPVFGGIWLMGTVFGGLAYPICGWWDSDGELEELRKME